jgi:23S rRNA (guanosine2251-2'-O)-methyltransferase
MGEKIYGRHAIEEGLKLAPAGSTLFIARGNGKKYEDLERNASFSGKVAVKKISLKEMDKMAPGLEHRGILLELKGARKGGGKLMEAHSVEQFVNELGEDDDAFVLILDGITDPQNFGAILRSCDQFSVGLVVIPERRSVKMNETVVKVSSGAAQYVSIATVTNINREIDYLKEHGFWIFGADMSGTDSDKTTFTKRTALVMGSEGSGLSTLSRKKCDQIVSIPMSGHIDSLNVSVAAGILMYEVRRQDSTRLQ